MLRVYPGLIFFVFSFVIGKSVAAGEGLPNGQWRAILERKDGHSIVFNFESKDSAGKKVLYIRNAAERLLVDDIKYQGDSVLIRLPFFNDLAETDQCRVIDVVRQFGC